jgi:co-chaperonin GroES (HSP10)
VTLGQIVDRGIRDAERVWANPSWWNLLVAFPWALGAILFIHDWKVDREIASREQTTKGLITAHEPANHNRYGYVFSVNGRTFNGWESPKKEELKIGEQVVVYYDPQDPNKNALTDFGELGMSSLGPMLTMLFGIGVLGWYIGSRRRQHRINSNLPSATGP